MSSEGDLTSYQGIYFKTKLRKYISPTNKENDTEVLDKEQQTLGKKYSRTTIPLSNKQLEQDNDTRFKKLERIPGILLKFSALIDKK